MNRSRPFTRSLSPALLLLGLFGTSASWALSQRYQAPMHAASWSVQKNPGECALVQDIPRYGTARFEQRNGRKLSFRLLVDQGPVRSESASVETVPPPWMHDVSGRELATLPVKPGNAPISTDRDLAQRLIYELEQGMFPEFHYRDWADQYDAVTVAVSAVRFRDVLPDFRACVAGLIKLDFNFTQEHIVFFATNSDRLNYNDRRQLDKVIRAYKKLGTSPRLIVGGHADERGSEGYNLGLSRQRAEEVKRYLARRGIPASKIEVRAYGERWPAVEMSSNSAWSRNRRATIWFVN